jgi:hypothetical protein
MTEHINGSESCVCQGGWFTVARQSASTRSTSAWVETHGAELFVARLSLFYRRDDDRGLHAKKALARL